MVTKLDAEVKQKTSDKLELESTLGELAQALARLKLASEAAKEAARQSSGLVDQARVLTDKYNLFTTHIRDVVRALDCLHGDLSSVD